MFGRGGLQKIDTEHFSLSLPLISLAHSLAFCDLKFIEFIFFWNYVWFGNA